MIELWDKVHPQLEKALKHYDRLDSDSLPDTTHMLQPKTWFGPSKASYQQEIEQIIDAVLAVLEASGAAECRKEISKLQQAIKDSQQRIAACREQMISARPQASLSLPESIWTKSIEDLKKSIATEGRRIEGPLLRIGESKERLPHRTQTDQYQWRHRSANRIGRKPGQMETRCLEMIKRIGNLALVFCCLWPPSALSQDPTSRAIYETFPSSLGLKYLGPQCPPPFVAHVFHWSGQKPNQDPYCSGEIQGIDNEPIYVGLGKEGLLLHLYYIGDHGFPGVFIEIDSAGGSQKDWYTVQFWRGHGGPDLVIPAYNFSQITEFGKGHIAAACLLGLGLNDGKLIPDPVSPLTTGANFRSRPLTFTYRGNPIVCNADVVRNVPLDGAEIAFRILSKPAKTRQNSGDDASDAVLTQIAAVDLLKDAESMGVRCGKPEGSGGRACN